MSEIDTRDPKAVADCTATLMVRGEHYRCMRTDPGHDVHGNPDAGAVWQVP